jgi:hypothetical protein
MSLILFYKHIPELANLSPIERKTIIKKINKSEPFYSNNLKSFVVVMCLIFIPEHFTRDYYHDSFAFRVCFYSLCTLLLLLYRLYLISKFRAELHKQGFPMA